MKLFVAIAAVAIAAATASFAGGACCPAGGKAKAEKSACTQALSGIELSAEQQAKIAEIEAACKAEGMTADACSKSMKEIRAVLTDDQRAQFDAKCEAKGKKSCG